MKRTLETRALPILIEKRNDLLEEMETLVSKADTETRALNKKEVARFNQIKEEVTVIDETLKAEKEERQLSFETPEKAELRVFKPGEKLKIATRDKNPNISLGQLVKAMSGIEERTGEATKYLRDMTSSTGAVVIPKILSEKILDKAREQSSVLGAIPITVMAKNNLTVAKVSSDASANWVIEGNLIPESSVGFEGVNLEGKTLAMYVPISEQLLSSANISDTLMNACSKAIATALDKSILYGTGETGEIKGISTHININKISHTGVVNYNALIKGIQATKGANVNPTDICYNTTVGTDLSMLTDTNGQYIVPPKVLDKYAINESNNINDNQVLVYNRDCMLLGINENMTMEWGYTSDGFQRMIKALRIYIRCDLGVTNESGISVVTATPTV